MGQVTTWHRDNAIGKKVETIGHSPYGETVTIGFDDGSQLVLKAATATAHNDTWGTVSVSYVGKGQ